MRGTTPPEGGAEASGRDEHHGTTGVRHPDPQRLSDAARRRLDHCVGGTSVLEYLDRRGRVLGAARCQRCGSEP